MRYCDGTAIQPSTGVLGERRLGPAIPDAIEFPRSGAS